METTNQNTCQIHTLEEIVMRKNMVLENIHNDDTKIKELWGSPKPLGTHSCQTYYRIYNHRDRLVRRCNTCMETLPQAQEEIASQHSTKPVTI